MKAIVLRDFETGPALEDLEVLEPRAGEVAVRIAASGICGSDIHAMHGASNGIALPAVMGHEGAGIVEAIGPGVTSVAPGDRVVLALYGPCYSCAACMSGNIVHCNGEGRMNAIFGRMEDGTTRLRSGDEEVHPFTGAGSLAEVSVVREQQLVRIPDDVPLDVMCLAGCGVTTGLGAAFNTAKIRPGQHVAIVGCGGVGLSVLQGAVISGAARILAIDTSAAKLELAARLGATDVAAADGRPVLDIVSEVMPGGADVVFEVVGQPTLVAECLEATRPGGTCVMVGASAPGSVIPVKASTLFWDRNLTGCVGGSNIPQRDLPRIIELYQQGKLDLEALVGVRVPMDRFAEAFAAAEGGDVARSVVLMDSEASGTVRITTS